MLRLADDLRFWRLAETVSMESQPDAARHFILFSRLFINL